MLGWLSKIRSWWHGDNAVAQLLVPGLQRLERVILTDAVARMLFEGYAEHRRSQRGEEEIGWILLGYRQAGEAIALAALPAGTQRDAGEAHIRFNSDAQALASRILRQNDKRLQIVGIVHTHPGSMRTPSDGDLHGDSQWVGQLRGGEGVFAIGTADVRPNQSSEPNVQTSGDLCFSWYALGKGERRYRALPFQVRTGVDLAAPLRPLWNVLETHAEPLNRLCQQFAQVQFEALTEDRENLLLVKIKLAGQNQQLRLLLSETVARYYWDRDGEMIAIDPQEERLDRAIYLILAELAKEPAVRESPVLIES